jgi:hypothetical protein
MTAKSPQSMIDLRHTLKYAGVKLEDKKPGAT